MVLLIVSTPNNIVKNNRACVRTEVDVHGDGHGCVLLAPSCSPDKEAHHTVMLGPVAELVRGRKAAVVATDTAFWTQGDFLGDGCEQVRA